MAIDQEKIAFHIRGLLEALGEDPDREGLVETPERVARMYAEVFEGINYTNHEIADMFEKTFTETKAKGRSLQAVKALRKAYPADLCRKERLDLRI